MFIARHVRAREAKVSFHEGHRRRNVGHADIQVIEFHGFSLCGGQSCGTKHEEAASPTRKLTAEG